MPSARERGRTSLYDGDYELSQVMDVDPASITPLGSRVLIRDIPDEVQTGSIFHPQVAPNALGQGNTKRHGIVVAVGRGDYYSERLIGDGKGGVHRKALGACPPCNGSGSVAAFDTHGERLDTCPLCLGDGKRRLPMEVSVEDRVLYDFRREASIFIDGQMYQLVDEGQSILGVLE